MLRYVSPVDQLLSGMFIMEAGNKRRGGGGVGNGRWKVICKFLEFSAQARLFFMPLHGLHVQIQGGFPMLHGVDFQPVTSKVHYQSSLLVVLVPQCA